jgi:hypothetical protein
MEIAPYSMPFIMSAYSRLLLLFVVDAGQR